MPDYQSIARNIAIQQGIDPNYFTNQIRAESNFDPTARSPAGALGIAQIVPRWHPGVDPMNPIEALRYAAKHDASLLKQYGGDWRDVLSVYNSGQPDKWRDPNFSSGQTYNYVRKILGENYTPGTAGVPSASPSTSLGGVPSTGPALPTSTPAAPLPAAPSYAPPNISGALLGSLGKDPSAQLSAIMGALLSPQALPTSPQAETSGMPTSPAVPESGPVPRTSLTPGEVGKWASLAPSADRGGARTNQSVLSAVARIARVHGSPLTISTGTNHNQFVVDTNRESQHWQGNAADIAYGHGTGSDNIDPALTRLGRAALVAAGMPRAEAAKQTGGVFNVGGWNILFNTYTGGNHYNHLHVGV